MAPLKSVIGFDFGTKYIGVASGQMITKTASALTTMVTSNNQPDWAKISNLLQEWRPDLLIVGLPLDLDGNPLPGITKKAKAFARNLTERFDYEVVLHDERLTTKEARASLFEQGGYKKLTKHNVDNMSAILIVESWLRTQTL